MYVLDSNYEVWTKVYFYFPLLISNQCLNFPLIDLLIDWFIYFTFRQIFTDIEAVIVIYKITQSVQSICHITICKTTQT